MPPPATEALSSRLFIGPALRAQNDRRLVTLVREGYESAFEEIVRRYGKPLTRYAASIVGSRSEDVTQDAFSKALLALRRESDADIELRPWLYRIVRNTALNDLRDRPPTAEILEEALAAGRGTAAEVEEREQLRELIEGLRELPERQRAAIVMRELEGLSHEEIAATLGVSGGAARQAVFRAREGLRSGMGLLLPLPIVRFMLEHGDAAGAGATGTAGALAAGGAAGGAGTALKAGAVAAILAGSVGTGIALQHNHGRDDRADAATISTAAPDDAFEAAAPSSGSGSSGGSSEAADDHGGHGDGPGDERGGHGREPGDEGGDRGSDDSSHRSDGDDRSDKGDDDRSGRGRSGGDDDAPRVDDHRGARSGPDDSGHSGSGGSDDSGHGGGGGGEDRSGHGGGDDSETGGGSSGPGSGSSGSGGSGEDNSGPGGGDDLADVPTAELEPIAEDNSGSASSGSGSSGSSGRGGGDETTP